MPVQRETQQSTEHSTLHDSVCHRLPDATTVQGSRILTSIEHTPWLLQLLGLKSFRTGAVMLAGLLLYDVFWVFGSPSVIGDNVMLTVATSDIVSGPTRLLFPRVAGGTGEAASFPFSLLGQFGVKML